MLEAHQVLDHYYLETRCMLLEIAATLDRFDRAVESADDASSKADPRLARIQASLAILSQPESTPDRAERLLNLFTDND